MNNSGLIFPIQLRLFSWSPNLYHSGRYEQALNGTLCHFALKKIDDYTFSFISLEWEFYLENMLPKLHTHEIRKNMLDVLKLAYKNAYYTPLDEELEQEEIELAKEFKNKSVELIANGTAPLLESLKIIQDTLDVRIIEPKTGPPKPSKKFFSKTPAKLK